MDHTVSANHGGAAALSAADWESFQQADYAAARNIVCLMGGVFTVGLIGYLMICFWVA
jgi:hypothetical protein